MSETAKSRFEIPCLCGASVLSHGREAVCEHCGRLLVVEWGKLPVVITGRAEREEPADGRTS